MALSATTALKQSFAAPTESGLEPVIRGRMLHPQADNDDDVYEEDLDAINAAVNELIRLEARGQRLNLTVEDVKAYEALATIAERFREFGLSNRFSETIISAIEECAINNGTNFARKNKSEILTARIELTDKKPELTKGRSHYVIAFDGQQKHAAKYSTVEIHYTAAGTKTTTTSMPDLENMFVNKTKYLVFIYEGREGDALNSPENVAADLSAIAANGAMPAEAVQELQAAIENGTITPDQVELIQAVAELGRVMELTATTPEAIQNPAATIERLQNVVAEMLQSPDVSPALADAAKDSVRKMEIIVSSPEFSALITQGAPIDVVAENDNQPIAETMEVLEQAGLDDSMIITLTTEQQAALQDFIQQSDLPASEQAGILTQISEGTLERATFDKIEAKAVEVGAALPDAMVAVVAEVKEAVSAQAIEAVTAEQIITLNEPQREALEELLQKQDIPAAEREQLLAQIEQGSITRESFAKIEQMVAEAAVPAPIITELKQEIVRQDVAQSLTVQPITLSEPQREVLEQLIQKQDMPAADREQLMAQIEQGTITRDGFEKIERMASDSPVIATTIAEIRDVVAVQDKILPVLAEQKVFLSEAQQQTLKEIIARQDLPPQVAEALMEQVATKSMTIESIARLSGMDGERETPSLQTLKAEARDIIRAQQGDLNVPVAVPLTPVVKQAVIDAIGKMDVPPSVKRDYIEQVRNEAPTRSLVNTLHSTGKSSPAIDAFKDQSATRFARENAAQMLSKVDNYIKNPLPSMSQKAQEVLKDIQADLLKGKQVSWTQKVQLAQHAPDIAKQISGTQTFDTPVRKPEVLISQLKDIQKDMARTYPTEAKVIAHFLEKMEANPKESPKIFDQMLRNMPAKSNVLVELNRAADRLETTVFQPVEDKRETLITKLEEARNNVPPQQRPAFDDAITSLTLGNPVDRRDLNNIVQSAPELHETLSDNLIEEKVDDNVVSKRCRDCPTPCGGKGCGSFSVAASVNKVRKGSDPSHSPDLQRG